MILFASTGSWGEVSPLLSLAIENKGRLACGPEWIGLASHYDVPLHVIGRRMQLDFTIAGFMHALDMDQLMFDLWHASEGCEAIVSAFFLWPAQIVAELRGIPHISTTTSPIYFNNIGAVSAEEMGALRNVLNNIRSQCKLPEVDPLIPSRVIGLYPALLHTGDVECIGYPRLEALGDETPEGDFCLVSSGSINPTWELDAHIACDLLGLRCEYLKSPRLDFNHAKSMRQAKAAIIHGGIGTLVDAIAAKVPLIVRPYAYDQFYNASVLKAKGAAVWPSLKAGVVDAEIESNVLVFERFRNVIDSFHVEPSRGAL